MKAGAPPRTGAPGRAAFAPRPGERRGGAGPLLRHLSVIVKYVTNARPWGEGVVVVDAGVLLVSTRLFVSSLASGSL